MDNPIGSCWFENGLPIPVELCKEVCKTVVYIDTAEGRVQHDLHFLITDETKMRTVPEGKILVDRGFPPLIMILWLHRKDGTNSIYWTNLAEYALTFLIDREITLGDIENDWNKL